MKQLLVDKDDLLYMVTALDKYNSKHRHTYGLDGAWDDEITSGELALEKVKQYLGETNNMTSGRDTYLSELGDQFTNVVCDQCGEWYRFDDKMRHAAYERILCYNANNGYTDILSGVMVDEYGYAGYDHYTHWMPLVFPR